MPYAQAAGTHDKKMFETMKRALPAGFTAAPEYPLSTDPTPYPTDPTVPMSPGTGATIATNVASSATISVTFSEPSVCELVALFDNVNVSVAEAAAPTDTWASVVE